MKALRLKLYQETACYKKPFAFKVAETYPLPPHSTVKGMLHALLEAKELIPMRISIQGRSDALLNDYQTHYFFKKANTNEFALILDGLEMERAYQDITTMPIYSHMLYHVELLIHVHADEAILEEIVKRLECNPTHLSLGRWEDLVRLDEYEIVNIVQAEDDLEDLPYDAYIPEQAIGDTPYFPYQLNWTYRVVQGVRVWDKLRVGYVNAGSHLAAADHLYVDAVGHPVFLP